MFDRNGRVLCVACRATMGVESISPATDGRVHVALTCTNCRHTSEFFMAGLGRGLPTRYPLH